MAPGAKTVTVPSLRPVWRTASATSSVMLDHVRVASACELDGAGDDARETFAHVGLLLCVDDTVAIGVLPFLRSRPRRGTRWSLRTGCGSLGKAGASGMLSMRRVVPRRAAATSRERGPRTRSLARTCRRRRRRRSRARSAGRRRRVGRRPRSPARARGTAAATSPRRSRRGRRCAPASSARYSPGATARSAVEVGVARAHGEAVGLAHGLARRRPRPAGRGRRPAGG